MPQRRLHIFLALALVLFSWLELEHATDLDAHHGGESCNVCLFASPLGHGATPTATPPLTPQVAYRATPSWPTTSLLPPPYRLTLGQRGPPADT